jgi:hypothetical protein
MKKGYLFVNIGRGNPRYVHQLVLEAFVGPRPPGMEGRHKDGIKAHCWLGNLEYGTPQQNAVDRVLHGTANGPINPASGNRHGNMKITEARVAKLRKRRLDGASYATLQREFPEIGLSNIQGIVQGRFRVNG